MEPSTLDFSPLGDKTAAFHAFNFSLVELFPDPGIDRYRVSLELRQLQSRAGPAPGGPEMEFIGFYFGYSSGVANDGTTVHAMYGITFKDYPPPIRPPPKKTPPRAVFLRAMEFFQDSLRVLPSDSANIAAREFTPKTTRPGDWRPIEIELTPDGARVEWLDDPPPKGTGQLVTLARISGENLRRDYAMASKTKLGKTANLPVWSPRMSFGVLSHRSSVAIRNVVITPLP